eukprot:gene3549-3595_t
MARKRARHGCVRAKRFANADLPDCKPGLGPLRSPAGGGLCASAQTTPRATLHACTDGNSARHFGINLWRGHMVVKHADFVPRSQPVRPANGSRLPNLCIVPSHGATCVKARREPVLAFPGMRGASIANAKQQLKQSPRELRRPALFANAAQNAGPDCEPAQLAAKRGPMGQVQVPDIVTVRAELGWFGRLLANRWLAGAVIVAILALAVLLGLVLVLRGAGAQPGAVPAYVVRVVLPDGTQPIGLPPIEGPADASRPLVVIDAGHGGHDPGASGPRGEHEKALTLGLALALRDALIADGRVRVALTRADDRFLVLEERAGIARRLHADLFLSIHADAADVPEAAGATIYTLSDKGSGAMADALAARENRVDTVNGVALDGQGQAVSQFLVDLSQQRMRASSLAFAALIRREGEGHLRFRSRSQEQAAFVVLKSLDVPSALLEAGYVSNPDDVRDMRSRAWRNDFGRAVARAIEIFLASQNSAAAAP